MVREFDGSLLKVSLYLSHGQSFVTGFCVGIAEDLYNGAIRLFKRSLDAGSYYGRTLVRVSLSIHRGSSCKSSICERIA